MADYQEGMIADGPNGPLVFRGGAWVPLAPSTSQGPSPITIGRPDPARAYAGPKAAADLQRTQLDVANTAANAPIDRAYKQAQLESLRNPRAAPPSGYRFKANGDLEPIPGGPIVGPNGVKKGNGALDSIVGQINTVSNLFRNGPGATSGLSGIGDYFPSDQNAAFDAAAAGLEDQATLAFKVPGQGAQSDADAARIAASVKPNRFDRDSANRQRLSQLRARVDAARVAAGLPPAQWAPDSVDASSAYQTDQQQMPMVALATGATKSEPDPRTSAMIDGMVRGGLPPSEALKRVPNIDVEQYAAALAYQRAHPNYRGGYGAATKTQPTTLQNRTAASPVGAFAGNAINALTADNLDSIAGLAGVDPAQTRAGLDAVSAQNPTSSLLGTVLGGAAAAGGLEAAAPLAGLRGLAAARGADALYGAAAGAGGADDGNRLLGAGAGGLAGAGGGMFGRALGRTAGRGLRGVTDPNVTFLSRAGVPLTLGQTLGGTTKGIEDRLAGFPVVGDLINNRRREGLQAFNRKAFSDAVQPIGATPTGEIGERGIDDLITARRKGYRDALSGVSLSRDARFDTDFAAARQQGGSIPRTGVEFEHVVKNRVDPLIANNPISGAEMQDVLQGLRGTDFGTDAMGSLAGDALGDVEGAFRGLVSRQSPGTLPRLANADATYRNSEVLRAAVNAARNGTRTGEGGLVAPSQLADAAAANSRKYGNTHGTTQQPFFDITRAGQALPSQVPDSGTAGRWLLGSLATGGVGAGAGATAGDTKIGAGAGLAAGMFGSALYSKAAQRAMVAALLKRGPGAIRLADQVDQYGVPLLSALAAGGAPSLLPGR